MAVRCGSYLNIPCQRPGCRNILPDIRNLASHLAVHDLEPQQSRDRCVCVCAYVSPQVFRRADRYVRAPRHSSFVDMGHSVADGRTRRRYMRSPAPYARSDRSHSQSISVYPHSIASDAPLQANSEDIYGSSLPAFLATPLMTMTTTSSELFGFERFDVVLYHTR